MTYPNADLTNTVKGKFLFIDRNGSVLGQSFYALKYSLYEAGTWSFNTAISFTKTVQQEYTYNCENGGWKHQISSSSTGWNISEVEPNTNGFNEKIQYSYTSTLAGETTAVLE